MEKIKNNKMTDTPMLKLIITMSVPAMFSMLIQSLYNVVDSIYVAQLSQKALTAISLAYPLQVLIVAVAVGTGVGVNSIVARKLGADNKKDAESAIMHGLVFAVICWLVFFILGVFITKPFIGAYTNDPIVYKYGVDYTRTVLVFSMGVFFHLVVEKALQAMGSMVYPMLFQLFGAVLNIILDPLLIFGIGPFPRMEVLGAAVATVISQIAAAVFAIIVLFIKSHEVKISFKNFKFSFSMVKDIYAVGLPAILMQSILSVVVLFLNSILMAFSAAAVNVLSIYYKLQSFVFMPVFGLTQGVMPIMGYNYGAKNKKRLINALKHGIIIGVVIMAVGTAIFWIVPEWLLGFFNPTQEIIDIGVKALKIISIGFVPAAVIILITTLFQALGKGIRSLILSALRQLGVILPVAYFFSYISLNAVWYAFPISEAVTLVASIILFIGLYKRDIKTIKEPKKPTKLKTN